MPLLYEQLRAHLLDEIRSGRLSAGDRIPSELALAEQFNVSRITSKKALETLERDGLIVRFRGKGSFVTDVAPPGGETHSGDALSPTFGPDGLAYQTIGYVYPDQSDVFGTRLLHGIEEAVSSRGLQLSLCRSRGKQSLEVSAITRLVQAGIRGLIVFPIHGEYYNDELVRVVINGFPVVLVDRYLKGIAVTSVGTNNVEASRALVDHLIGQGCRRLAFISPPPDRTSSIEDRRRGFGAGLRAHHLGVDHANFLLTLSSTLPAGPGEMNLDEDMQRIHAFLDANPDRDGFVVVEYPLAQLLERVLRDRGQEQLVPCITCFDAPRGPFVKTPFTHVRQDEHGIGTMAVEMLLQRIDGGVPPGRVDLPFTIVEADLTA